MAITPQTNLFLIKVPIEIDNKNQLTFANKTEQLKYFTSLENLEVENFSYQRKDSIIRFPAHIDTILEYNYCIYQNSNYSNKWFYAFITNMTYINDNMTEIAITTDVWQTWQFDLKFKQSFIEREMLSTDDDIPGANLIPEGLEFGEMKIEGSADFTELTPLYVIAYLDNEITLDGTTYNFTGGKYNGILNGILFIVGTATYINEILFTLKDKSDKIMCVFTIPKCACPDAINDPISKGDYTVLSGDYTASPVTNTFISRPNSLDGYTPRNKKLLTYPYLYLGFNPQNGTKKIYRYEDFKNSTPVFKMVSELNQNPTIYFIPRNYRGNDGDNVTDCCSLNGYPTCSWKTDYFNTWLAQNSEIISLNMQQEQFNYQIDAIKKPIQGMGNIVGQATQGNAGALLTGATLGLDVASLDKNHEFYVQQQMAQVEKQSMLPDTGSLGGSNATLLGYNLMNKDIFNRYNIKKQFAQRIDKYFDMYGYLTNTVKKPNTNNRPNWNYVKTIGANIEAYIPQQDLQLIKNMFDNGITLWHKPDTFLDYSQNNR